MASKLPPLHSGRHVWFEYDEAFVHGGLEIAPLRLPLSRPGLHEHRPSPGAPVPGVFNDARPEGWGLKLLHRAFQARGRAVSSVSPLDELAYLGSNTLGALVFEPTTGPGGDLADAVALGALASHARDVWHDHVRTVLPDLLRAGGPSGGARPKALIALPEGGGVGVRHGEGDLPPGWGAWLVKFPTEADDADVGPRAMYRLAVFNVAAVNEDDPLRNVAWLLGPDGVWSLSPAFDLTYAPRPYGERWTTVAGVGREVGLELARGVGIKRTAARRVIDEVVAATSQVRDVLRAFECAGPVSQEAALQVDRATARLRG